MAVNLYFDGTAVHYNTPQINRETSKKALEENRNKKKQFSLGGKARRELKASCAKMFIEKKKKEYIVFGTVTYPSDVPNLEKIRQRMFLLYLKNLRQNYGLSAYVAVKEKGEKGGLIHYHVLFRMLFIKFTTLNQILNETFKNNNFSSSNNCFTTNSRAKSHVIKNYLSVVKYITKYVSKNNSIFEEKCYFISESTRASMKKHEDEAFFFMAQDKFSAITKKIYDKCVITTHDRGLYDAYESTLIS